MKKIIHFLITLSLCFTMIPTSSLSAEEKVPTTFISDFAKDMKWGSCNIEKSVDLYDIHNNKIGIAYKLSFGEVLGYAIVIDYAETQVIVEAGRDSQFVYDNIKGKAVYNGPNNYYAYNGNSFVDLCSEEEYFLDAMAEWNLQIGNELPSIMSGDVTITNKYVASYSSYYEGAVQTHNACIPYSTAMALKYLYKRNKFTCSLPSLAVSDIASTLMSLMVSSDGHVYDSGAKNGISTFASNYTNKWMSFTSAYTDYGTTSFNTVKSEIDVNYPAIVMFKGGVLYDPPHATCMFGYQTRTAPGADTAYYVIVRDPGTTSCPERVMLWNNGNIYGTFVLTIG